MDLVCPDGHPNPPDATQCNTCFEPLGAASGDGGTRPDVGGGGHASDGHAEPGGAASSWDAGNPWASNSPPPAASTSTRGRHGWRMTLPNYATVPLEVGKLDLGRATHDPIGPVLQLFQHVSRHHVTLNVTEEVVTVYVAQGAGNPVFTVREDPSRDEAAERFLLKPVTRSTSIDRTGQMTLCLGQCCFIRIDRGEA